MVTHAGKTAPPMNSADPQQERPILGPERTFYECHYCGHTQSHVERDEACCKCGQYTWEYCRIYERIFSSHDEEAA
jgi:hypothetical protein